MTDIATVPAGIEKLSYRCWYLLDQNHTIVELLDGEPHFASDADARVEATLLAERHQITATPRQVDAPCWTVTARCGERLGDDGEHYESVDHAMRAVFDSGWTTADGAVCCEDHGKDCQPLLRTRLADICDDPEWPLQLRAEARAAVRSIDPDAPLVSDDEIRAMLLDRRINQHAN